MKKRVLIFSKHKDPRAWAASQTLSKVFEKKKWSVETVSTKEAQITDDLCKALGLGVVIGGDGTFLALVNRISEKHLFPLMGFNLGTLGFITEFNVEEMEKTIDQLLTGELIEEQRPLLKVELVRGTKVVETGMVFNDVVLNKDTRTSLSSMDVSINGKFVSNVRADGYIVATSTGSTGYALSAGGPLVHPGVPSIILIPICPHALSLRPIVIPQSSKIEIRVHRFGGTAYIVYDGQINLELKEGDLVRIEDSKTFLRLYRSPRQGWTDALKEKLSMG